MLFNGEEILITDQWQIQDFLLGGWQAIWGVPTSDMGAFWQKHMQKRKN